MVDEVCQSVSLSFACGLIVARLVLDTQRSAGFGFAWCFGTPGRLGLRCSWNFGVCFAVFCFVSFLFSLSPYHRRSFRGKRHSIIGRRRPTLLSTPPPLLSIRRRWKSATRSRLFFNRQASYRFIEQKQLAFETGAQRRRRQTSPDGSRKAGHDSQHLQVALATRRNEDGNFEDAFRERCF
jgi:hypothetical protein